MQSVLMKSTIAQSDSFQPQKHHGGRFVFQFRGIIRVWREGLRVYRIQGVRLCRDWGFRLKDLDSQIMAEGLEILDCSTEVRGHIPGSDYG